MKLRNKKWSLYCKEDTIPAGSYIFEFVGEIVSLQTKNQREEENRIFVPICDEGQYFVDNKFFGNEARFIGHSENPNCKIIRVKSEYD